MTARIAVAVCTWNRAPSLRRALESICIAIEALGRPVQFIVVNNNCTDATDEVIAEIAARRPLTHLHEPRPGVAHARNAAIAAAQADYIVWTDDDVIVAPQWLAGYAQAFDAHPRAVFFGGRIRPRFEPPPPAWLAASWPQVGGIYAVRDLGEEPLRITRESQLPYGANFALRLDLQRQLPYDVRLGRQPGNYWLAAEETQILGRLLAEGHEGWWVPEAALLHCIPRERQTLAFIARHAFGVGQSKEISQPSPSRWRFLGRPVWMWREWLKSLGRVAPAALSGRAERWVPVLYRAAEWSGRLSRPRRG
ncbi:MAG: glycosyltransferase [Gammaproteobacteria bacterium]|nr:glycosyltransferase [Gammaproteobacteria bacterium]